MIKQVDNGMLGAKLDLRRWLIQRVLEEGKGLHVLDCCAGDRVLWKRLEREWKPDSYVGLDIKRKPAPVLKADSVRWLRSMPLKATLVDVDTYGEPWKHWRTLLRANWTHDRIGVCLTMGNGGKAMGALGNAALKALGIPTTWRKRLPPACDARREAAVDACMYLAVELGCTVLDTREAGGANRWTRYIAVMLERRG